MQYLTEINKPTWLRYVLVPDYTDDAEDLENWAKYVSQFKNVERVDILPFPPNGRTQMERNWQSLSSRKLPTSRYGRCKKQWRF